MVNQMKLPSTANNKSIALAMQCMPIKSRIRTVPHWPKQGIMFRDITTLLKDPLGYRLMVDDFVRRYRNVNFDVVVGIESRGFILGAAIAYALGKGFVPIRKKGKLPAKTVSEEYTLEYGKDTIEMHADAIMPGTKVILVDDLLATGGTAEAAANLLKKVGADIVEIGFVVDLPDIGGRKRLQSQGYNVYWQCEFEGD